METVTCTDNPFRGASSSPRFIEQLHSKGYFGFLPNEQWTPNVNLYEIEFSYLVCVDLAGVDKDKIDLEIVEGRLTIRGKRAVPIPPEAVQEHSTTRVRIH